MPPDATLDRTFAALADPTRRAILARLVQGDATVNELAAPFAISLPAISRHLKVLEAAELISRRRIGQFQLCRLSPHGLRDATEWLEFYRDFWNQSLDRLEAHLKQETQHGKGRRQKR
jgi:DNA-binding transcriptional ArsR family regulator